MARDKSNANNYIIIACTIVVVALVAEVAFFISYSNSESTYDLILNVKKESIKSQVERTITDIEEARRRTVGQLNGSVHHALESILVNLEGLDLDAEETRAQLLGIEDWLKTRVVSRYGVEESLHISVVDRRSGELLISTDGHSDVAGFISTFEDTEVRGYRSSDDYELYLYISNEQVDRLVKAEMMEWVRNLRLVGVDYLWINEVISYDGGHDYAIRLVHPNLPETEGVLLSTETQDIMGNKPYLEELQGINQDGEVFFTYYFKEFKTDQISKKLSYAKLYEPYDWIVATGIYLNDVEALKGTETYQRRISLLARSIVFTALVALAILIVLSWRVISKRNDSLTSENASHAESVEMMLKRLDLVEDMAYRDYLTSTLNRRGLFARLGEEISRMKRQEFDVSVVMLDIDYFKAINDTFGHDFGDQALIYLANEIQRQIRKEDVLGRIGGDEFVVILPYANLENAVAICDKLIASLNDHCAIGTDDFTFTVSMGITRVNKDDTVDSLIKRADIAMYQCKRGGRNGYFVYQNQ